jgi:hypothetical protein
MDAGHRPLGLIARRGRNPGRCRRPPRPAQPGRLLYLSQGCLHAAAHGALIEDSVPIAPTLGRLFCLISSGIGRQPRPQ